MPGGGRGWGRGRGRGRGGGGGRRRGGGGGGGGGRGGSQIPETPPSPAGSGRAPSSGRSRHGGASGAPIPMDGDGDPDPIAGWSRYFPGEDYAEFTSHDQLEEFRQYFDERATLLTKQEMRPSMAVTVDYTKLILANEFAPAGGGESPLVQDIRDEPDRVIRLASMAIHQIMREVLSTELSQDEGGFTPVEPTAVHIPVIHMRLQQYEPITPLKSLKANYIGKYIAVRGTVVRVSNVKPLVTMMAFACPKCDAVCVQVQPDGKFAAPTACPTSGCRAKALMPQRSSKYTETVDFQKIRVQEIIDDGMRESGRIPRTLECELTNDLVDSCVPGDIAVVAGEVKVASVEDGVSKAKKKDQTLFLLYLHANSITGPRTKIAEEGDGAAGDKPDGNSGGDLMEFTLKDLYLIQRIQEEDQIFRLLVNSLCPAIYGHELVKAGLLLGLFGGRQKYANDVNRIAVRGDPHVLVVGDPGLGKSQMLRAISSIAPRGVYVCGNTTTTAGLTVTLHKDGSSGDYALEAGALVLGDQGVCCIDEFDKMGTQHTALLEAMEQQCISIAKAGIVCSLPARTSIIAAANPVGGHYDKSRTVSENLKMNPALLSRFDLVFILVDEADDNMDRLLSAHVMALHGSGAPRSVGAAAAASAAPIRGSQAGRGLDDDEATLGKRLELLHGEEFEAIPAPLLRKYVGYARKYVHPILEPEARRVLQAFYLELRNSYRSPDSTPITTRQIESLVRLAEARARMELRETVTADDAHDVVELMKSSMMDIFTDDLGGLDYQRSQNGSGMSKKAQAKRFVGELSRIAEETFSSLFTVATLRKIFADLRLEVGNFMHFIDSLNNQGFLLKKGPRSYQLQTSAY